MCLFFEKWCKILTFLLKYDRDHVWVVVSDGHVEGGLHGNTAGIIGESFLCLQVRVGPVLKQLCSEARQATTTCSMKWALTLNTGKVDHVLSGAVLEISPPLPRSSIFLQYLRSLLLDLLPPPS